MAHKYFCHSVYLEGDSERGLAVIDSKETMYLAQNCLDETGLFCSEVGLYLFNLYSRQMCGILVWSGH